MGEFRTDVVVGDVTGEGAPLLVLHGGPGMSDYMAMAESEVGGWRAIHYTQRGVPPSITEGPFTLEQHVADAVGVLDQLGLVDAVVLGHSWGGFLAAALAAAHPQRVRALLLVDPLGILGEGGFEAFSDEMVRRTPPDVQARAEELDQRAMDGQATDEEALESMRLYWPAYYADPSSAPPMPDGLRLSTSAYSAGLQSVTEILEAGTLPAAVAEYQGPVEVLYGLASPMPAETSEATAAAFPKGVATGVPDAGHMVWHEAPGSVHEALDRLAARL